MKRSTPRSLTGALRLAFLVVLAAWTTVSIPFMSDNGVGALIAGPMSIPWIVPTMYSRLIGEPAFRRSLRHGMTREQVHQLVPTTWASRAEDNGDLEAADFAPHEMLVRFTRLATFCVATGEQWLITLDADDRVTSWKTSSFGENC